MKVVLLFNLSKLFSKHDNVRIEYVMLLIDASVDFWQNIIGTKNNNRNSSLLNKKQPRVYVTTECIDSSILLTCSTFKTINKTRETHKSIAERTSNTSYGLTCTTWP